jgi:hypothetical protein
MVGNIASISSTNHSSVKPQAITVDNIASISSTNHSSVKPQAITVATLPMLAMLPTVIA